jgi:hypothetical protein
MLQSVFFLFILATFFAGGAPVAQAQIKPGGTIIEALAMVASRAGGPI